MTTENRETRTGDAVMVMILLGDSGPLRRSGEVAAFMPTSTGTARSRCPGEEDRVCEVHPALGVPRSLVSTSVARSVIEVRRTVPPRMLQNPRRFDL